MRKYLAAEDRFTRLRLFDTLELLVNTISDDLATKARRLKRSLIALGMLIGYFERGYPGPRETKVPPGNS